MRFASSWRTWRRIAAAAAGLAVTLAAGQAAAADNLVPGKIAILKPGKLAKGIFKPATTLPLDGDPTGGFANLQVFDTVDPGAGAAIYDLPSTNWKGLGTPPGAKGFKYKGAGTPEDPCKVVLVKPTIVKFVCKGTGVTLAPPANGNLGAILTTAPGSRYCASFGGTEVKNDATIMKRKEAPAPASCPIAPGPAVCGDGVQQAGEQCDDGNVTDGDGCNALCELETLACDGGVIGERLVTVSLNVPDVAPPGTGLATARVTIGYPEVLMGIPGEGDSSLVLSRISGTPLGTILVNDQSAPLTVAFLGLPPNIIPENATTQFVVADFDTCVTLERNFCSRNQQVLDCCNAPGTCAGGTEPGSECFIHEDCDGGGTCGGGGQTGRCAGGTNPGTSCLDDSVCLGGECQSCLGFPPTCPAGQFPPPGADPGPCAVPPSGSCPTEDFCLPQLDNIVCSVSETADENGTPVDGVTCTINVVETINP